MKSLLSATLLLSLLGLAALPTASAEYYEECDDLRVAELCTEHGDWDSDGEYECTGHFLRVLGDPLVWVGQCDGTTFCKASVIVAQRAVLDVCYSNSQGDSGVWVLGTCIYSDHFGPMVLC